MKRNGLQGRCCSPRSIARKLQDNERGKDDLRETVEGCSLMSLILGRHKLHYKLSCNAKIALIFYVLDINIFFMFGSLISGGGESLLRAVSGVRICIFFLILVYCSNKKLK